VPLENSDDPLSVDDEEPWPEEPKTCMQSMRSWIPPSQDVVSSPIATCLRSSRVPGHILCHFLNQKVFYGFRSLQLRATVSKPPVNMMQPGLVQEGLETVTIKSCSRTGISKLITFSLMTIGIYLDFSTGNLPGSIQSTGNIQQRCDLVKEAGGLKSTPGLEEIVIPMSWTLISL
jgi:hypothetical protein